MSTTIKFEHEAQVKEEIYRAGEFFIYQDILYTLTQIGNAVVDMVDVRDGNRKTGGVSVSPHAYSLKAEVIDRLFESKDWQRVSVEITTKPYQP